MCDDWHTWHPVLSPFEAGEYRVLRDWQVAVADVLLLREAWRLGSVHELYLSVERAVLDESYGPVWPRAAAPELCDVARLLGVPERAQIAALRFCHVPFVALPSPAGAPVAGDTASAHAAKPRVLFSAQLIADVTGAVGPAVSESLRCAEHAVAVEVQGARAAVRVHARHVHRGRRQARRRCHEPRAGPRSVGAADA